MPTVASATTPDIFGAAGATINYTGTTTATSFVACAAAQIGSTKTIIPETGAYLTASANLIVDGATSGDKLLPADSIIQVLALSTTKFKVTTISAYGLWTPSDQSGAGLTFTGVSASYAKTGGLVTLNFALSFPTTASAAAVLIGGLPFVAGAFGPASIQGFISATTSTITARGIYGGNSAAAFNIDKNNATEVAKNVDFSGCILYGIVIYRA